MSNQEKTHPPFSTSIKKVGGPIREAILQITKTAEQQLINAPKTEEVNNENKSEENASEKK
ncbi:MAG: hypothetical protein M3P33_03475 [bacterium]|nr:hypothetical protein [bacterium]